MGAFARSLLECVRSTKAMALRILQSLPPGYVSQVAIRARVGSGHPSLPLHGVTWWLGIFFHVLGECHGGYSCLQREGNKQHEEKRECAHAYIYERLYMLMFSLEFPRSGLGLPQHPRGPLSQQPTKRMGIWAWHIFFRGRCVYLGFYNTHRPLSPGHTKTGCAPCPVCLRVCACADFNYGNIWLPITWVITRPPVKQDLG